MNDQTTLTYSWILISITLCIRPIQIIILFLHYPVKKKKKLSWEGRTNFFLCFSVYPWTLNKAIFHFAIFFFFWPKSLVNWILNRICSLTVLFKLLWCFEILLDFFIPYFLISSFQNETNITLSFSRVFFFIFFFFLF